MKGRDNIVPVLIAVVVVLVAVFCVFFVELPAAPPADSGESGIVQSGTPSDNLSSLTIFGLVMNATAPNETRWVSSAQSDNARLVSLIKKNALPLNNLATICMVHINNNNEAGLTDQAAVMEKTAIAAWDETDVLTVSPGEYTVLYDGYRSALTEYMMTASGLKMGMPQSADAKKTAYSRLVSASNRMIDAYNDIDFDVEYPDDVATLVRNIEVAVPLPEPEVVIKPLVISDAKARGTPKVYMDARDQNRISVNVPLDSGRLLRSFYFTDAGTNQDMTMTAPDGKMYYMITIDYTHAGHLDGTTMTITPPAVNSHILRFADQELKPVTLSGTPIGNGLSVGMAYNTAPIDRLEKKSMLLFYEVPADFSKENAYLSVNLGNVWGTQIWKLW
jgi:hypothetical protein